MRRLILIPQGFMRSRENRRLAHSRCSVDGSCYPRSALNVHPWKVLWLECVFWEIIPGNVSGHKLNLLAFISETSEVLAVPFFLWQCSLWTLLAGSTNLLFTSAVFSSSRDYFRSIRKQTASGSWNWSPWRFFKIWWAYNMHLFLNCAYLLSWGLWLVLLSASS